ncbi:MAG TPA: DUF4349 domain-containing protein [Bacteroidales bacterium]|jgi:hypothetical protein|nr:DUF4349 domain-containing protein [Bacteroidales bacterium]
MKTIRTVISLGLIISLFNCKSASKEMDYQAAASDSAPEAMVSSSAAVENNKDTTRKFIRTAELKFRVNKVIKTTYDIENITSRHGGFVTYTNLMSNIDYTTSIAVSPDSSLETTYFTVTNTITLRVPNTELDTTLKEISKNIVYLDYRIIKAEDVALQILSNKLTEQRAEKSEERLGKAIDDRGKKLRETTEAEALLQHKEEQADKAVISNLSLADQINFSTINISIYQRQQILRELVPNNRNIEAYKAGLGRRIIDSLEVGWRILEAILLFVVKLWALILIGIVIYFIYRRYSDRPKK